MDDLFNTGAPDTTDPDTAGSAFAAPADADIFDAGVGVGHDADTYDGFANTVQAAEDDRLVPDSLLAGGTPSPVVQQQTPEASSPFQQTGQPVNPIPAAPAVAPAATPVAPAAAPVAPVGAVAPVAPVASVAPVAASPFAGTVDPVPATPEPGNTKKAKRGARRATPKEKTGLNLNRFLLLAALALAVIAGLAYILYF